LYNPQLKGSYNFVPGVMAMILLLVCSMMTSISIVREKEIGTMEVILVSPIVPIRVVLAKMVPYLILSAVNIASILLLSVFVLDVPINGSLTLLVFECLLFTVTSLSLAASGYADLTDGYVPPYDHVERLYVPDREHANRPSGGEQHRAQQMVFRDRQERDDQRRGHRARVETNAGVDGDDGVFVDGEY
jgi:hypothetical protein